MKALVIDSATPCISIAARNNEKHAQLSIEAGRHQSEHIIPCIEQVLSLADLHAEELNFAALCAGPGSFTGLRLGFAALKGLAAACPNPIPVYGIGTLEAYALPYSAWQGAVIPVIDARKHRFYAAVYRSGTEIAAPQDAAAEQILAMIDPEERALAVGADAAYFAECAEQARPHQQLITFAPVPKSCCEQLFFLAEKKFRTGEKGITEFDGPQYFRAEI
ncbi:MAG: tRNA (adenosine(37)-N6)-threonylcarbamoyltransferase complex dimerization subunit type 1 TsaB [Bacteroides sp.]|nr:tRNA (adenosine(37)-N6)-threonylcarbamoyltransferase complex dimerization subunit type 1 TsaB [Prevotella sp.]MCM1408313.1 tRNA (adenosine(37)-N6)-threonylcarbamoyltransferase complex dimerization subunit type 1 TsaB [Treponema brennaborense]MCM1470455.1 tRNA (adenosine(37)-N6)-threonylcarbamoyltransferase complex dimerization subunit type 1 TsaB [Bacteroides sp.]